MEQLPTWEQVAEFATTCILKPLETADWWVWIAAGVSIVAAVVVAVLAYKSRAPMRVSRSLFIITGAAGDIGRALALKAARSQAVLALWDADAFRLAAFVKSQPEIASATISTASFDIRDSKRCSEELAIAVERYAASNAAVDDSQGGSSRPHGVVIVNNAGVVDGKPVEDVYDSDLDRVLSINLLAPLRLTAEAARLAQANEHDVSYKVVNVASIMGLLGSGKLMGYCASKAGLLMATEAARMDAESCGLWPRLSHLTISPFAVQGVLFGGIFAGPAAHEDEEEEKEEDEEDAVGWGGEEDRQSGNYPTPSCCGRGARMDKLIPADNCLRQLLFPLLTPAQVATTILSAVRDGRRVVVVPWLAWLVISMCRLVLPPGTMDVVTGFMGGWSGMGGWKGGRSGLDESITTRVGTLTATSVAGRRGSRTEGGGGGGGVVEEEFEHDDEEMDVDQDRRHGPRTRSQSRDTGAIRRPARASSGKRSRRGQA